MLIDDVIHLCHVGHRVIVNSFGTLINEFMLTSIGNNRFVGTLAHPGPVGAAWSLVPGT